MLLRDVKILTKVISFKRFQQVGQLNQHSAQNMCPAQQVKRWK